MKLPCKKNIDRISHLALNKMLVRYGLCLSSRFYKNRHRNPAVGFNLRRGTFTSWLIFTPALKK